MKVQSFTNFEQAPCVHFLIKTNMNTRFLRNTQLRLVDGFRLQVTLPVQLSLTALKDHKS